MEARDDASVRALALMGAGGNFCAGGDLKGMQGLDAARGSGTETTAASNRRFGALLEMADGLPKAVIVLIEGAAAGGGVGLAAIADWVIAERGARIATPEVTVGIVPAQIAPFVVRRTGYSHARRLAACGLNLGAEEAQRIGLVHEVADGRAELMAKGVAAVPVPALCASGLRRDQEARSRLDRSAAGAGARRGVAHVRRSACGRRQGRHPRLHREAQAGLVREDRGAVMTYRLATRHTRHPGACHRDPSFGLLGRERRAGCRGHRPSPVRASPA